MTRSRLLLLSFCLTTVACAPEAVPPPTLDTQATLDTLARLADRFSQAYMAGNSAAMTALYTDDAVLFPGDAVYIRGKDAIERYWTLPEGRRISHHKITSVEVDVSGSMASDFGHYEITTEGDDGTVWGPSYGKYLIVWKRGPDGHWRMHLDMWNSRPPPEN